MAEEWVKDAQNEARAKANLRAETKKALGTAKQKIRELTTKVTAEERERRNTEASLKNAQDQVEEQCKKLYYVEIKLATAKQQAANLKAELTKAKEAAQEAKEATKASEQKSYNLGVQEIEACLIEELAEVYKEYHHEVWIEALNLARVLATSKWRKAKNIYYR